MANRGSGSGQDGNDEWVTGETATLEETSQTDDESSFWEPVKEYLPYWVTWGETYYGMAAGYVLLFVLFLALSTVITCWDSSSLSGSVTTVKGAPSTDTYDRWQGALEEATRVRRDRRGGFRSFFHTVGLLAPGTAPGQLRARLSRLEAYTASLVEYRFEHAGSRPSSALLDDELVWRGITSSDDKGEPPLAAAGRTLRALARGDYETALTTVEQARKHAPDDVRLLRAHLQAALAADRAGTVKAVAGKLNSRQTKTAYDRYLLYRSAAYHPDLPAAELAKTFSSGEAKDHLGVRIAEVAHLRREGKVQKARTVGTKLLDGLGGTSEKEEKSEPTFPIARLHNEIGRACVRLGKTDCADKHFGAAVEGAPGRGSIHVPRIESLLDRTKLTRAEDHLDRAEARAGRHTELTVARARLQYLRSRWDEAAATLDRASETREFAPVLRARILLELGEYQKASSLLEEVPANAMETDRVRALQLLASQLASSDGSDQGTDAMADVTGDSDDAVVLRAGARYHLERARAGSDGEPLKQARKLLERAANQRPNPEITTFLRCELERLAEEWDAAGKACAEARRTYPEYLPGMLSAIRLRLETQRPERAALLAGRLAGRFDDWEVAKLRIRALLRTHDLTLVEEILASWSDRDIAGHPEFKLFEGRLDFARANYSAAAAHFEKAQISKAYGTEASLYYTHTLVRLGRFEKAEGLLDKLTDDDEWKGPAWAIFGELRRRQDEVLDALENLRIAKRHLEEGETPRWRFSQLYGQMALTWRQHRDWGDTRVADNLEEGREQGDPRSPEIAYPYGLYLMAGRGDDSQPDRAVTQLSRVVDAQPYNCGAIKVLEKAYEEIHDWAGRNDMQALKKKRCSDDG